MSLRNPMVGALVAMAIIMAGRPLTNGYTDQGLGVLIVILGFAAMAVVATYLDERDARRGIDRRW